MDMRFRSFRSRILVFFLGLIVLVQAGVLVTVDLANALNARRLIDEALEVTARQFARQIATRSHELGVAARLLSGDFAFKQVLATRDAETIRSALANHQLRIGADAMAVTSVDGADLIADTIPDQIGLDPQAFIGLIEAAEDSDELESSGMLFLDSSPHRMVTVPVLAPLPVAWIHVGFLVDDRFAKELQEDTRSQVSLFWRTGEGGWTDYASTLPIPLRSRLGDLLSDRRPPLDRSFGLDIGGEAFVTLITALDTREQGTFNAVLQRSREEAMAPFFRLRLVLFLLTIVALSVSVVLANLIARTVSRPVQALDRFAQRIEKGRYDEPVHLRQEDEIGHLARSLNRMADGLKEREFIRETFGKYVPESVAAAILKDRDSFAPELRMATVLYTDIQGFTAICEAMPPKKLVAMLNAYFSLLVGAIDSFGGVVNQFQGDAMLVTYNVPVADTDHAASAIRTALEIQKRLQAHRFDGGVELVTRIGINSGNVVAGSIGAGDRLSYTVHGDTVNLAARLEALNKEMGTRILVSEATRDLVRDRFRFESMGEIPIRGRSAPVPVFCVLP